MHHRAEQHVVGHQIRSGRAGGLVALANHLAHVQAAAGKGERAQAAPVIATAPIVDARSTAEFAGDHE